MVKALQKGRSAAIKYADVEPVSEDIVEKTLPHIKSQQIRDMVQVQRFICGRPQDVHNMRLCDIEQSGEVWRYVPFAHKTKWRGKIRELPIGPRAQQILQPYLDWCKDDPTQFVFPRPNVKRYQNHYANAIAAACKKAGVPPWTPNQLRHAGGTEVRNKFGLEYAQAVLGHSNAQTTEIYAKVSFDKAAEVAREIG
jgi:integrase